MTMAESTYGSKNGNGAREKAAGTASDIQDDLQGLQQDVAKLTQQLTDIVAAKGSEVWRLARENVDDLVGEAGARGKDAADALRDVTGTLTDAIDDSIERRPYTTLAMVLGLGFVLGAIWKR
jgi:ElaB/YqjD/DUF883 family membrane-anchored ribosome-binding protein